MNTIMRAATLRFKTLARIQYLTTGFIAVVTTPIIFVIVSWSIYGSVNSNLAMEIGPIMLGASCCGLGIAGSFQITADMWQDRSSGALLRIRVVPGGPTIWIISELLISLLLVVVYLLTMLLGIGLLIPQFGLNLSAGSFLVLVALGSYTAMAPWMAYLGTLIKTNWAFLGMMFIFMVLFAGTGTFFPVTIYPVWISYLCMISPFYWTSHLVHWYFVPEAAAKLEPLGSYYPIMSVTIFVVLFISGMIVARKRIYTATKKESVSSYRSAMQSVMPRW